MDISTESLFSKILKLPGNDSCFECDKRGPDWASLGFGVLICLECAGRHRALGVHITLVRSMNLDSWTPEYMALLKHGGNDLFRAHLGSCLSSSSSEMMPCSQKYFYPEVLYYKELLQARVESRSPRVYDASDYADYSSSLTSVAPPTTAPTWGKDKDILRCVLCNSVFSILNRRHHCRKCGRCVCDKCGPKKNTKPILEWGMREPVRHCKQCYKSPMIKWSGALATSASSCSSAAVAAGASS